MTLATRCWSLAAVVGCGAALLLTSLPERRVARVAELQETAPRIGTARSEGQLGDPDPRSSVRVASPQEAEAVNDATPVSAEGPRILRPDSVAPPPLQGAPRGQLVFEDGSDRAYLVSPAYVVVRDRKGRAIAEGPWVDGRKQGRWRYYEDDGSLCLVGAYHNGAANGRWTAWTAAGQLVSDTGTRNGQLHGTCYFYSDPRGRQSGRYQDGELIEAYGPGS